MLNKKYLTDEIDVKSLIKYLKTFEKELNHPMTIWCPFGLENSSFVKELSKAGFKVISFSIDDKDFFPYEPKILFM